MMSPQSTTASKCERCKRSESSIRKENILTCSECEKWYHANERCSELDEQLISVALTYNWRCPDCKYCEHCRGKGNARNLVLCDGCDRGYHKHCLNPPITRLPEGKWICPLCRRSSPRLHSESDRPKHELLRGVKRRRSHSVPRRSIGGGGSAPASPTPSSSPPPQKKRRRRLRSLTQFISAAAAAAPPPPSSGLKSFYGGAVASPTAATPSRSASSPSSSSIEESSVDDGDGLMRKSFYEETCPTVDCTGFGHLSGKQSRHKFVEACPRFHNLSIRECQEINEKRRNLSRKSRDGETYKLRVSSKELDKQIIDLSNKRESFDESLRKRVKDGEFDKFLSQLCKSNGEQREPLLNDLTVSEDLELFRMAQAAAAERMQENTKLRNLKSDRIKYVRFGSYEIEAMNASCFPEDVSCLKMVYICEFCLKYLKSLTQLISHMRKCTFDRPPGDLVYKKGVVHIWQVDGSKNKIYCQNLCLLAKLFLDHKTLYYDVEPFNFYILTEMIDSKYHFAAYFSKEKESMMNCNLSCILTLPPFQNKGYGKLLIEMSYILSKIEDKVGSPEHPLSDMGLIAYRGYWKEKIDEYLAEQDDKKFSVKDLSQRTGIHVNDIVSTLQYYGLVKYWRGAYWVFRTQEFLAEHARKTAMLKKSVNFKRVDVTCLKLRSLMRQEDGIQRHNIDEIL